MNQPALAPTPNPAVNRLIEIWFVGVQAILGLHIRAVYLDGSLTNGAFDQDSDVDFVVVTDGEIAPDVFAALQGLHSHLAQLDPRWGVEFEGSYLPDYALQRYDPAHYLYPNIERGPEERLKLAAHDQPWDVHRSILHERGIVLLGPPAHTLIDPVAPDQLRAVMRSLLAGWGSGLLEHPERIGSRGYQSYIVLSMCRVLFTLQTGQIASKPAALAWARADLEPRWHGLLERAWQGRSQPGGPPDPLDLTKTLDLLRYTIGRAQQA
jgi:hypothetical protein